MRRLWYPEEGAKPISLVPAVALAALVRGPTTREAREAAEVERRVEGLRRLT